jgi:hypothetical protein
VSNIPLPALAIQPPQQQDPLASMQRLMALKSLGQSQQLQQQQIQSQQQQLADQQAMTQAFKNWDPKTQTYDDLAKSVTDHGGSATAAMNVTQHGLQMQQGIQNLTKDQLANFKSKHEAVGDALEGIEGVPDEQLHDTAAAKVSELSKNGILDPQTAQQAMQTIQSTPDPQQLRSKIDMMAKTSLGALQVANQAKTQAETSASNAKAGLDQAQTWLEQNKANVIKAYQQNPQQLLSQIDQIAPPTGPNAALNARTKSMVQFALGNGDVEGAKAALKQAADQVGGVEKDVAVATNPAVQQGKVNVATAEGQARANIEAQQARGSNAELAQVPPHLINVATTAADKADQDYAQSKSVSDRLTAMMDAAKKGNVVSYQLIPQEGALQVTTSQGVHRINMAEIQNYGGGSLWQRMQGHFGKTLTGESIPDPVLNDMSEMQKIQAEGSQTKYENTLKSINQRTGATFKPVEMEDLNGKTQAQQSAAKPASSAPQLQIGQSVTLKNGKTVKITAVHSDGTFDAQ